jgi:hypothetical protein
VRAVESAGGRPLLVPPSGDGVEETLLALLQAALFRALVEEARAYRSARRRA